MDKKYEAIMPLDIVGGSVPYDPANHDRDIWFRASRALGTERLVYQYRVYDDQCFFLAIPSSVLSQNPFIWCPLVEALPGGDLFEDKNHIYLFEKEGISGAVSWNKVNEKMEVFAGYSRIVLPKVKLLQKPIKMIKETDTNPHEWHSRRLRDEGATKRIGYMMVMSALLALIMVFAAGIFLNIKYLFDQEALLLQHNKSTIESIKLIKQTKAFHVQSPGFYFVEYKDLKTRVESADGELLNYNIDRGKRFFKARMPKEFDTSLFDKIDLQKTILNKDEVIISAWLGGA